MTFEATEEPGRLICDGSEHKISDFLKLNQKDLIFAEILRYKLSRSTGKLNAFKTKLVVE